MLVNLVLANGSFSGVLLHGAREAAAMRGGKDRVGETNRVWDRVGETNRVWDRVGETNSVWDRVGETNSVCERVGGIDRGKHAIRRTDRVWDRVGGTDRVWDRVGGTDRVWGRGRVRRTRGNARQWRIWELRRHVRVWDGHLRQQGSEGTRSGPARLCSG